MLPVIATLLSVNIAENGFLVMPCLRYAANSLQCRMAPKAPRCEACMLHGHSCDGSGVLLSAYEHSLFPLPRVLVLNPVDRILSEQRRLNKEEREAERLLSQYQRKASEALARLQGLRRQNEVLV